ncbi:MAG TPA: BsuPI-related putative proteinase inhibitor [Candidatus Acidoferrales bacterium]|nr:BsuPI-related putative proteinase inhibitor [Candidatus Acidoferrales bacterium]
MIALFFAMALAAVTPQPLTLTVSASPLHAASLVPVTVSLSVTNRTRVPITLDFPSPDLFDIQIIDKGGQVLFDSRSGHNPIEVHRKMTFPVGRTSIATYAWSGLTDDHRALAAPAQYTIHVEMASTSETLSTDVPLSLDAPQTIDSVVNAAKPVLSTISGTPERDGAITYLRDDTGRVAISAPLGIRPQGTFIVRGIMQTVLNQRKFVIDRFAPASDNSDPEATTIPRAMPLPARSDLPRSR